MPTLYRTFIFINAVALKYNYFQENFDFKTQECAKMDLLLIT